MNFYVQVASSPDPLRCVRTMTDGGLNRLVDEMAAIAHPNDFHVEVYSMAMHEVLMRWRQTVLSVDLEVGQTTEGTEGHGE